MSFERVLEQLLLSDQSISSFGLAKLSGLSPAEMSKFSSIWPSASVERRRNIVRRLAELAEDNTDLDFNAIFSHLLTDDDAEVRQQAIEGLWEVTDRELILPLIERLLHDQSVEVRAAAAVSLGRFAYMAEVEELRKRDVARIEEALLGVIRNHSEPIEVRRRAIEAIGVRSLPEVSAIIDAAYRDNDLMMRASALYAMGRNCDTRWLPVLYQELTSTDPQLRFEAVNACGEIGDEEAVPQIIPLLDDSDLQVQLSAVAALGHIGGDLARQALQRCLRNGDPRIRDAAQDAIEEMNVYGDPLGFF